MIKIERYFKIELNRKFILSVLSCTIVFTKTLLNMIMHFCFIAFTYRNFQALSRPCVINSFRLSGIKGRQFKYDNFFF